MVDWNQKTEYSVSDINAALQADGAGVMAEDDRLFEAQLADVAKQVAASRGRIRLILFCGASNAGKTTASAKLAAAIRERGISAEVVSLDDFFMPRDKIPRLPNGVYDYESPLCVDRVRLRIELFALFNHELTVLPRYDFITGKSEQGRSLLLERDGVLIFEGIHTLNPMLFGGFPEEQTLRVFLRCSSYYYDEHHNLLIEPHQVRLLRRLVRDRIFRGASPELTFTLWEGVRRGEERYILPYRDSADICLPCSYRGDVAVLKDAAVSHLKELHGHPQFGEEADRLVSALQPFVSLSADFVSAASLQREFIGGLIS